MTEKDRKSIDIELATRSPAEIKKLVHNLHIHQVELEMQNDELRRIHVELTESRDRYSQLYNLAPVGYLTVNELGIIIEANQTLADMLNQDVSNLIGKGFQKFIYQTDRAIFLARFKAFFNQPKDKSMELRLAGPSRFSRYVKMEGRTVKMQDDSGRENQLLITVSDVTELHRTREKLRFQAFHDPLTGLPNRNLLNDHLIQSLARCRRYNTYGALLFLDLDNFKTINDSLGHPTGDDLLKEVADRLRTAVRTEDTAARLGGDEFVVLLTDMTEKPDRAAVQAESVAVKIQSVLSRAYSVHGKELHVTPSIGITLFPYENDDSSDILRQADSAMYKAKQDGRNSIRFYRPSMQRSADARLRIEKELRHALEHNEFQIEFQPQYNVQSQKITGAEALVRWNHPTDGVRFPGSFIPFSEMSGLIFPLGAWVLETSLLQFQELTRNGLVSSLSQVCINVSPREFRQANFVEQVREALVKTEADSTRLTLELTEGVLIDDFDDTTSKIRALKDDGVSFAIDDFGTGYSSLSYLKRLPLDAIKIDKSFVADIPEDKNDLVIVRTIIGMAKHLGLKVIAEGVETKDQVDFLSSLDCFNIQGHYFSPSLHLDSFSDLCKSMPRN